MSLLLVFTLVRKCDPNTDDILHKNNYFTAGDRKNVLLDCHAIDQKHLWTIPTGMAAGCIPDQLTVCMPSCIPADYYACLTAGNNNDKQYSRK